jgi:HTH-type transcriptional regulator / antitoxin MqsA
MRYETRKDSIEYKGHKKEIDTTAWWCGSCGEAVLDRDVLAASEKASFELQAKVEDVLSPARVAAIRSRLGISQREAGELLGGGPRAFQKYESGPTALSVPMSNLLRLLENEPARLKELRKRRARARFDERLPSPVGEVSNVFEVDDPRVARDLPSARAADPEAVRGGSAGLTGDDALEELLDLRNDLLPELVLLHRLVLLDVLVELTLRLQRDLLR